MKFKAGTESAPAFRLKFFCIIFLRVTKSMYAFGNLFMDFAS